MNSSLRLGFGGTSTPMGLGFGEDSTPMGLEFEEIIPQPPTPRQADGTSPKSSEKQKISLFGKKIEKIKEKKKKSNIFSSRSRPKASSSSSSPSLSASNIHSHPFLLSSQKSPPRRIGMDFRNLGMRLGWGQCAPSHS